MTDTPQTLLKDVTFRLLSLYDFEQDYKVELLKYSENIIYKISFEKSEPVVFRVHRPDYHNFEELKSELVWIDEIRRDTDLEIPILYKGKDGEFLQKLVSSEKQEYFCSVISFLYGKAVGELKGKELLDNMEKIGAMTAKLHLQSINRDKSVTLTRPKWDLENFFGENAVWGHWQDYIGLNPTDVMLFNECERIIKQKLNSYGRYNEHYGIIHADLHFFNIIADGDKSQIIDFDDCGYGFYLYELGCTLVTYSQNLDELTTSWLNGYESIRKLSNTDKKLIPLFILLRRIVRLAWLSSHADSDTAKTVGNDYLTVTRKLGEKFLGQYQTK